MDYSAKLDELQVELAGDDCNADAPEHICCHCGANNDDPDEFGGVPDFYDWEGGCICEDCLSKELHGLPIWELAEQLHIDRAS